MMPGCLLLFCLLALRQAARGRIIKLTETGAAPTKAEAQWFDTLLLVIHKINGVAPLIANPANSTTMYTRLGCQDRNLGFGCTVYWLGLAKLL